MTSLPSSGIRPRKHVSNWFLEFQTTPIALSRGLEEVCAHTKAREVVLAVDVHGAGTADTLTATPPEDEGGILLVLDLEKGVKHHLAGLVEVEFVALEVGLLCGVVGVPAVDLESLHPLGLVGLGRLADGSHGASKHGGRGSEGGLASSGGELGAEHPGCGRTEGGHCVFCECVLCVVAKRRGGSNGAEQDSSNRTQRDRKLKVWQQQRGIESLEITKDAWFVRRGSWRGKRAV